MLSRRCFTHLDSGNLDTVYASKRKPGLFRVGSRWSRVTLNSAKSECIAWKQISMTALNLDDIHLPWSLLVIFNTPPVTEHFVD